MELHNRILASAEAHGTIPWSALLKLYKHEKEPDIEIAVQQLVADGWIKDRAHYTFENIKTDERCISRTKKRMFVQKDLFDPTSL